MGFINWIVERCLNIAVFFNNAYVEVSGWIWPFHYLAEPLELIRNAFMYLALDFIDFGNWVLLISEKIKSVRSWDDLKSLILSIFPWLKDVINWFEDKLPWVISIIKVWWEATKPLITIPLDILTGDFNQLKIDFINFITLRLPFLATLTALDDMLKVMRGETSDLLSSEFKVRIPFLGSLSEIWGDIALFFTNPLAFLFYKFEDWFWEEEAE